MARRGNAEGTIFQRGKDGRWVAGIMLDNGRRKFVYGATREEVASKLPQLQVAIRNGFEMPNERITMNALFDQWLVTVKARRRPKTYVSYAQVVRDYLRPELGRIRLSRLRPQHVEQLLEKVSTMVLEAGSAAVGGGRAKTRVRKLSPRSVAYVRDVLRIALGFAVRREWVGRNVASGQYIEPPTWEKKEITPLEIEEAQTFLRAVRGDRLEAFFLLAITSGARLGELLGLTWGEVELEGGNPHARIRQQLQRVDGRLLCVETKTRKSKRPIALDDVVVAALREQCMRQHEERLQAGPLWRGHGDPGAPEALVFTTDLGTSLDQSNVRRTYRSLLKKAGLPQRRLHDLRHGFASMLIDLGYDLKVVSEMLGHSSIRVTADTYGHLLQAKRREVVQRLSQRLSGAEDPEVVSRDVLPKPGVEATQPQDGDRMAARKRTVTGRDAARRAGVGRGYRAWTVKIRGRSASGSDQPHEKRGSLG